MSLSNKRIVEFSNEDYLSYLKGIEKIDYHLFLGNFSKISFTIELESKPPREANSIELMIVASRIIAELTDGIILFEHEMFEYKVDTIYLSSELA